MTQTEAKGSSVTPRHVLCFLGKKRDLTPLSRAATQAIRDFATGFSVDDDYSQAEPDDRMEQSFAVCWDRVEPKAWNPADEEAVADHQSVLYVLGPGMTQVETVKVSMAALRLVERLIDAEAVAVKGESAGVAHGLCRWRELLRQGAEALKAADLWLNSGLDAWLSRNVRYQLGDTWKVLVFISWGWRKCMCRNRLALKGRLSPRWMRWLTRSRSGGSSRHLRHVMQHFRLIQRTRCMSSSSIHME
ncbi:hypothetical protein GGE12_001052 [Rhizobium mongolense]|uniref:Uncharacterized protein n=1 Tax=Rhizobium mongolense TaxID=57676 RepID=A0A7W6RIV3_9HYPH|nr:hypothetical protein [Rhizobium mongolense]